MKTTYHRQGPDLTEVTYAGHTADGKLEHRATVSLFRTNDINRGIYRVRMDVKEPVAFKRFVFFQVGADTYNYTGWQDGISERPWSLSHFSGGTVKIVHSDGHDLDLRTLPVTAALTLA